ncbi:DMT family transporter [Hymenobacter qilianensis]|uniref:DMT family transporter n=1 Tax=Hymenobacter qilianensis TaxID=1385715 RepID=UPI0021D3C1E0|nr:DMT family transporter [Hymenobacter qilianensis]
MNQLLFFSGLNYTSPINASLLQTIAPIVVVIASAVLLGEKITKARVGAFYWVLWARPHSS